MCDTINCDGGKSVSFVCLPLRVFVRDCSALLLHQYGSGATSAQVLVVFAKPPTPPQTPSCCRWYITQLGRPITILSSVENACAYHTNKREKERNVTGGSSPAKTSEGTSTALHWTLLYCIEVTLEERMK